MEMYQSLDELPIKNWDYFTHTQDLRYFIKNINYNQLPDIDKSKAKELEQNYIDNIFVEYGKAELDYKMQELYYNALSSYHQYINNKASQQKANNDFGKYLKQLSIKFKEVEFEGKKYKSVNELYNKLKELFEYDLLMYVRLLYFDYRTLKGAHKVKRIDYRKIVAQLNKDGYVNLSYVKSSYKELITILNLKKEETKNGR